jgi:siderophore synthetase component
MNLQIELTEDERHAYEYLTSTNPAWATKYKETVMTSRDKITQRLITSMYRENLAQCHLYSTILDVNDLSYDVSTSQPKILKINYPKVNKTIIAPISGSFAFDRVDVEGPFYFIEDNKCKRISHPSEVLDCILIELPELNNSASEQFNADMINSAANLALAISFQAIHFEHDHTELWQLIKHAEDSYLRSEQAVIEGHPLHPGAKLRKGMTPQETINYSSEFGTPLALKFALLHKDLSRAQSQQGSFNETLFEQFDGLETSVLNKINAEQFANFNIIVIHPWQYERILKEEYTDLISSDYFILLDYDVPYYSGLSFRTLMPKYPNVLPHIKLATNVHITGEIRTLSEQTTYNGPLVTQILNQILTKDDLFENIQATTVDELAGIHFYNTHDGDKQRQRSEQLGTLFRKNIYQIIDNDATPVIASSLVSAHHYNPTSSLETIINEYMKNYQFTDFDEAAYVWLTHYGEQLFNLVIPLVAKYGIALEAHLQNTVVAINKDGSLNKIYIRDFEGLRINKNQLADMGYRTSNFHHSSLILTDKQQTVFNKAFYSTVQNHLGEFILTVAKVATDSNFESNVWRKLSDILAENIDTIAQSVTTKDSIEAFKAIIFAKEIDYKCVTTMRLVDEADYYTYVKVSNPLYR